MKAIILSVGDELVLGQTVDTNSAWISQQLAAVGCDIVGHQTVGDDQSAIEHAIRDSAGRCDVLLISGGIGPTEDDLTRQAVAAVLGVELVMNETWLARLHEFFTKLGREMPATNRIQAMIPRGATMIENTNGTAAGLHCRLLEWSEVFVMPGVPKEMKAMFARDVLPRIAESTGGAAIVSRTLHTFGFGESWIAEKLGDLMTRGRNPSVGTTVANGLVSLRINARFSTAAQATQTADDTVIACREKLGDLIFGEGDETLPQVVAAQLTARQPSLTVTTAESCTGGLLAKMLTDLPGSSVYFKQGWVTYSNEAKIKLLGVAPRSIEQHGAVSVDVASAMASGACHRAASDYALSISGVAGPTGGTPEKPIGTVCIALALRADTASVVVSRRFHFPGDREMVRDRSAKMALTMLRYHLLGKPMPF